MDPEPDEKETLRTRQSLLTKVRRGEEEGWAEFYRIYERLIHSAARAAGLSREESQDVVQETMITVRKYIGDFVPDQRRAKFRTWLRRIVHSRIADQYRKKKRNPLEDAVHQEQRPSKEGNTSTTNRIPNLTEVELDRLLDAKLEQAILAEARKRVKRKMRVEDYQTYDLFAVQHLTAGEVASALEINPITVRVRVFRVRRALEREVRRIAALLDRSSVMG